MNRNYTLTTTVRTDVEVMSLTEENTVDLQSAGTVPYQSRRVGGKHLDPVKTNCLLCRRTEVPYFIYKQPHVSAVDDHNRAINTIFLK